MKEVVKDIGTALLIVLITLQFLWTTQVDGESMEPNFFDQDLLILDRTAYYNEEPEIGDVVVFRSDLTDEQGRRELLIKRVAAAGGDRIRIEDGAVYVNGELQDDSFTLDGLTEGEADVTVPEGCVFVLGDNRAVSMDSRYANVGVVENARLQGRVVFRLFPFGSAGRIRTPEGLKTGSAEG